MKARATGRRHGAVVLTKIGYGLSGLLGVGLIVIGARFLVAPQAAAAGYGITNEQDAPANDPFLAVKGVRDIAFGVVTLVLLAAEKPHILGRYLIAASIAPAGDATIVLRHDGPKATAYGVHGATAAAMLATAALLLSGPE
ncbi:MAG TPA: DUF4267 domain-containing protein [Solirubrobacteraceae bacterium]